MRKNLRKLPPAAFGLPAVPPAFTRMVYMLRACSSTGRTGPIVLLKLECAEKDKLLLRRNGRYLRRLVHKKMESNGS